MKNLFKFLYANFDLLKDMHSQDAAYEIYNMYSNQCEEKINKEDVPYLLECIKNFVNSTLKNEVKKQYIHAIIQI